jgi:hypothetical protein
LSPFSSIPKMIRYREVCEYHGIFRHWTLQEKLETVEMLTFRSWYYHVARHIITAPWTEMLQIIQYLENSKQSSNINFWTLNMINTTLCNFWRIVIGRAKTPQEFTGPIVVTCQWKWFQKTKPHISLSNVSPREMCCPHWLQV